MKSTTGGLISVIIILSSFYFIYKEIRSMPLVLEQVAINKPSDVEKSYVPRGTFRNTETGEVFSYVDARGYLLSCGMADCKSVYFDIDDSGNIIQIRNSDVSPVIGKIISVTLGDEKADYSIEYKTDGSVYKSHYIADLCQYYKGGSKQCFTVYKEGKQAIVMLKPGDSSIIQSVTFFNKILKADVLEVVNVEHK